MYIAFVYVSKNFFDQCVYTYARQQNYQFINVSGPEQVYTHDINMYVYA